jgi:hypothetical protein
LKTKPSETTIKKGKKVLTLIINMCDYLLHTITGAKGDCHRFFPKVTVIASFVLRIWLQGNGKRIETGGLQVPDALVDVRPRPHIDGGVIPPCPGLTFCEGGETGGP